MLADYANHMDLGEVELQIDSLKERDLSDWDFEMYVLRGFDHDDEEMNDPFEQVLEVARLARFQSFVDRVRRDASLQKSVRIFISCVARRARSPRAGGAASSTSTSCRWVTAHADVRTDQMDLLAEVTLKRRCDHLVEAPGDDQWLEMLIDSGMHKLDHLERALPLLRLHDRHDRDPANLALAIVLLRREQPPEGRLAFVKRHVLPRLSRAASLSA